MALRGLGEPDAFPAASGGGDLERQSEAWRPWRGYAAFHVAAVPGR